MIDLSGFEISITVAGHHVEVTYNKNLYIIKDLKEYWEKALKIKEESTGQIPDKEFVAKFGSKIMSLLREYNFRDAIVLEKPSDKVFIKVG